MWDKFDEWLQLNDELLNVPAEILAYIYIIIRCNMIINMLKYYTFKGFAYITYERFWPKIASLRCVSIINRGIAWADFHKK